MPEMLNQHQAQLQHNAHPSSHQTHVKTGDPVLTGAAIFWGRLRGPQSPPKAPKTGSLHAVGPLLAELQQPVAAAAVRAAPALAGAA